MMANSYERSLDEMPSHLHCLPFSVKNRSIQEGQSNCLRLKLSVRSNSNLSKCINDFNYFYVVNLGIILNTLHLVRVYIKCTLIILQELAKQSERGSEDTENSEGVENITRIGFTYANFSSDLSSLLQHVYHTTHKLWVILGSRFRIYAFSQHQATVCICHHLPDQTQERKWPWRGK